MTPGLLQMMLKNLLDVPKKGEYNKYLKLKMIKFIYHVDCRAEVNAEKYITAIKDKNAQKKVVKQARKQLQAALTTIKRYQEKDDII